MLKKFRSWFKKNIKDSDKSKVEDALAFKNHMVDINGEKYFLAKGMITDVPDIVRVEEIVYDRKAAWNPERFLKDLQNDKNSLYLVIRKDDELIAFIGCTINVQTQNCRILNIAVLPKWQSRGLGYFLLTTVIRRARVMDLNSVSLVVRKSQTHAQDINKDLGFVQTGIEPDYYNNNEDAVVMKLDLKKQKKILPNNFGR